MEERGRLGDAAPAVPGVGTKRMRGFGRCVREILVWMKVPFLFRNELVVADAAAGAARAANPGEVRRAGKHAAIVALPAGDGGARIEVVASAYGCERASGLFAVGGSMR